MGCYINPKRGSVEQWLRRNGTPCTREMLSVFADNTLLGVCLVDNGYFSAALVVLSEADKRAIGNTRDTRPKQYFLVKLKDLYDEMPDNMYLQDHYKEYLGVGK